MLRLVAILTLAILLPAAASAETPIRVTVTSPAQEQMAKRLASAVIKELKRDGRFILVEPPASGAIEISLPSGVGWERRLDWIEIHYQARLNAHGQSRIVSGHCWNWNLSVCARQITGSAADFARGQEAPPTSPKLPPRSRPPSPA